MPLLIRDYRMTQSFPLFARQTMSAAEQLPIYLFAGVIWLLLVALFLFNYIRQRRHSNASEAAATIAVSTPNSFLVGFNTPLPLYKRSPIQMMNEPIASYRTAARVHVEDSAVDDLVLPPPLYEAA